jgi:hypothetical protein
VTRKPRSSRDPIKHQIEVALNSGSFISDRACFSFVSDLRELSTKIAKVLEAEPLRAVEVHETFLAGCYEKTEEIDDSSGGFGQFVGELHCAWITARQAAGVAADDTAARLLAWMDDDPYGFCCQLEKDAAKVLDKAGRAALEKLIRARFDATATEKPTPGGSFRSDPDYQRRRCGEILRALYTEQRNVEAYVALAEATEWTPQDCHTLATLLVARRKPGEALAWVKRGIALAKKASRGSMAGYQLARLRRDLLQKLGRGNEALEAAWAEYRADPSKYAYADLMKYVPTTERATWHKRALEAAKGADLHSLVELFLEIKELERLADLVRRTTDAALEDVSHYATEPAAKKLEKKHPDVAARLWRAQGMRVLNAKKSKYYDSALENFERAKRCYERAGLTAEWAKIVSRVRERHHRKMGFMSGFENLVAGSGPSRAPSFLERAKTTWGERQPRPRP